MRSEQLKYITALLTVVAAVITFYVFAAKTGIFFFNEKTVIIIVIFASAYAAFFSLYLSKRLERKRMSKRIFIIYSHKDKEQARNLTKQLREMGYNPWLDEEEIVPGQNWSKAINKAIEESAIALFLASKNTLDQKSGVFHEIKAAREVMRAQKETHSPIIPIYLEKTELPKELAEIHAVKFYETEGIEQLNKGLKYLLGNST